MLVVFSVLFGFIVCIFMVLVRWCWVVLGSSLKMWCCCSCLDKGRVGDVGWIMGLILVVWECCGCYIGFLDRIVGKFLEGLICIRFW